MTDSKNKLQNFLQLGIGGLIIALLSSCSPTKSDAVITTSSNTGLVFAADKALTQCNRSTDTNFTFNTAVAKDASGAYAYDILKLKFSFISVANTAAGNTIKFFKWRINGTTADLDQTPLNFYVYNLSTGATITTPVTSYNTSQINTANGMYIQLNDPNQTFQVIKVVVYDSAGAVVSQVNTLIPSFYASPVDYQLNGDGSPRASILQALHPLANQISSGATSAQFATSTQAFCF